MQPPDADIFVARNWLGEELYAIARSSFFRAPIAALNAIRSIASPKRASPERRASHCMYSIQFRKLQYSVSFTQPAGPVCSLCEVGT